MLTHPGKIQAIQASARGSRGVLWLSRFLFRSLPTSMLGVATDLVHRNLKTKDTEKSRFLLHM